MDIKNRSGLKRKILIVVIKEEIDATWLKESGWFKELNLREDFSKGAGHFKKILSNRNI